MRRWRVGLHVRDLARRQRLAAHDAAGDHPCSACRRACNTYALAVKKGDEDEIL
jgi:hypothetical protein